MYVILRKFPRFAVLYRNKQQFHGIGSRVFFSSAGTPDAVLPPQDSDQKQHGVIIRKLLKDVHSLSPSHDGEWLERTDFGIFDVVLLDADMTDVGFTADSQLPAPSCFWQDPVTLRLS